MQTGKAKENLDHSHLSDHSMSNSKTLQTSPSPGKSASAPMKLNKPDRFINREISWLEFNRRVLEEAQNVNHPLLERVRFLSISASNLDEFYMVRVAGLKAQVASHVRGSNPDRTSPSDQLDAIGVKVSELMADQHRCLEELLVRLEEENIHLMEPPQLSDGIRRWLHERFEKEIFPVLSPIAVDPAHPFPFIPNLGFALGFGIGAGQRGNPRGAGHSPLPAAAVYPAPRQNHPLHQPGKRGPHVREHAVSVLQTAQQRRLPGDPGQ
jgi:polyphosphate kinase